MSINLSTALSGVSSANERLRASNGAAATASAAASSASAANHADSAAAVRQAAAQRMPPVEPATAMVAQQSATYAFVANLRVLQTQLRAEGSMLDIHA